MNCIWILLLLCCCGNGNNSCGNVRGNENRNNCSRQRDCDCDNVRESREECREERREERDRNSCERIVPPVRSDFASYGRNDRCDDNDYNRRSGDHDRRDRRCDTCGCEAE